MAPKLITYSLYEVENKFELSLRQAFEAVESKLRPPFPITIPDPEEYFQLNRAIVYGVLSHPDFDKTHIRYMHAIVTDGYAFFTGLLAALVNELYCKLVGSAKSQLIWVTNEMVDVSAVGTDKLLVALLRRIGAGDFGDENVWLCSELLALFLSKWGCLLEDEPLVLSSALYSFLRLLADHRRFTGNVKLENVKRLEINFCVKMLREQLDLCLKIGRDLLRLLQDVVHVPEIGAIWKDLVSNPGLFRTPGFSDISQIYRLRTSSRYFLLRLSPEMETQLRYLLTYVKLGNQKRYQTWFWRKFLSSPEKETLLIDIVRFICGAHHPPNKIIQSDILPRWAVIGWLLKPCRTNYIEYNVKLALFYDWLFFDETTDNIMNVEPAILLMVCSVPQYPDMTQSLLGFLFRLVENYDPSRRDMIIRGVASAFREVVQKGVVSSLNILTSCPSLAPYLKMKLAKLLSFQPERVPLDLLPATAPSQTLQTLNPSPAKQQEYGLKSVDIHPHMQETSGLSPCSSGLINQTHTDLVNTSLHALGDSLKRSGTKVLKSLENVLLSFIRLDNQRGASGLLPPEELSSKIAKEYEIYGYKFFSPLQLQADATVCEDEIESPTALVIRTFLLSPDDRMLKVLLFWSHKDSKVGARILSYVARLACEICKGGCFDGAGESALLKLTDPASPFLRFHIDGYLSFLGEASKHTVIDRKCVRNLVEKAFGSYSSFHMCSSRSSQKQAKAFLLNLLYTDLKSCCEWGKKNTGYLFSGVFINLPDLCKSNEQIVRLLVGQMDQADLVILHIEIRLKKISIFGNDADAIFDLIKTSFGWEFIEQHKLWGLLRSELAVSSDVQLEKIVVEFFCCDELITKSTDIAVEGLLAVLSSRAPTLELVGMVLLLPNNTLQDFASCVLSSWAVSNVSMLVEVFAKSLEKLESMNADLIHSDSSGIALNRSAICWFLDYFSSKGIDVSDVLRSFSDDVPG